ncbi:MAG: aconitase X, partial [Oscillospiraceae bacterium]
MPIKLTAAQQAVLDGGSGEVKAKIMRTLMMYGEAFGATEMVPVTGKYGHLV